MKSRQFPIGVFIDDASVIVYLKSIIPIGELCEKI